MSRKHDASGFLCGWVGGAFSIVTTHPLDTIKVRLQLFPQYKGVGDCTRQIFMNEGWRSFYKGMSFPLITFSFYNSLIFGSYRLFLNQICQFRYGDVEIPPSLLDELVAASASGGCAAFVGGPIDLVKIRLQMQTDRLKSNLPKLNLTSKISKSRASIAIEHILRGTETTPLTSLKNPASKVAHLYSGPVNCVWDIYQNSGIRGLYRGTGVMILRDIPGYAIYLVPYFSLRHHLIKDVDEHKQVVWALIASALAGGCAGVLSWGGIHPIDTIKTRIQADIQDKNQKYRGIIHCVTSIYRENGLSGFFRGITMNALRGFPQSAFVFLGVEITYQLLIKFNKTFANSSDHP